MEGTGSSAIVRYTHTDHLTGSALVTDAVGTQVQLLDYHPWGTQRINEQSGDYDAKRKFAGHESDDELGLSYMLARYYNPSTGTFLSQDPAFVDIGEASRFKERYHRSLEVHLQNPQALNSYAYALNNPFTYRDPQGEIVPIILGIWLVVEIGLTVYDAYSTAQTLNDPNATAMEKSVAVGGLVAGLALPGGGYGSAGKGALRAVEGASRTGAVSRSTEAIRGGVYKLVDVVKDRVMRTGRSEDLIRRQAEHRRNPDTSNFRFDPVYRTDDYAEQRGLEQMLHQQHDPPLNKIQPISNQNTNLQKYMDAAKNFLGDITKDL